MQRGDLVIWKASAYYGDFRPDELAVCLTDPVGPARQVRIMALYGDLEERWIKREDLRPAKLLAWMVNHIIVEDFGQARLDALSKIVGLFNDCEEAEREIFDFANSLYERYAR